MRLDDYQQVTLAALALQTAMNDYIPLTIESEMRSFLLAEKLIDENDVVTLKGFHELYLNNVSLGLNLQPFHVYELASFLFKDSHSYNDVFKFVSIFELPESVSLQIRASIAFDAGIEIPKAEAALADKFDDLENQYQKKVQSLITSHAQRFYVPVDANSNKQNTKMWNKLVSGLPINGLLKLFAFRCKLEKQENTNLFLVIPHSYKTVSAYKTVSNYEDKIQTAFKQAHGSEWKLHFRLDEVGV